MKASYSLVLKLIAAAAILLAFLSLYLTMQQVDYVGGEQTTLQATNCKRNVHGLVDKVMEQEQLQLDALSGLRKELRRFRWQLNSTRDLTRKLTERVSACRKATVERQVKSLTCRNGWTRVARNLSRLRRIDVKRDAYVVSDRELLQNGRPRTRLSHEYEAIMWESFTTDRVYHVEDSLSPLPVETLEGSRKQELDEVLDHAVKLLNNEGRNYTRPFSDDSDLLEGYSQCEKTRGIIYDLSFRRSPMENRTGFIRQLRLVRPFAPIQVFPVGQPRLITHGGEWINVVLPLLGRLSLFKDFLKMFRAYCISPDKRVFLTVVYFGQKGRREAEDVLKRMAKSAKYENYKFLTLKERSFSRMRSLIHGVETWSRGNDVMLFCDVDVVLSSAFLQRCRMNTNPGRRVYFPIVFSLYDPNVVYADNAMPSKSGQLIAKDHTGAWRIHGYGIACQYRNDFLAASKLGPFGKTWGREGVDLFRRYVCLGLRTMRAFDRGIFHWHHDRYCDAGRPVSEYDDCLATKARYAMSHRQMGVLALKSILKNGNKTVK